MNTFHVYDLTRNISRADISGILSIILIVFALIGICKYALPPRIRRAVYIFLAGAWCIGAFGMLLLLLVAGPS